MGKYDAVIKTLPELPPELREGGANYQYKVDQFKESIPEEDRRPSSLAARYAGLRKVKNDLSKKMYDLNLEITAIEQLLGMTYEGEGITSVKVLGVGSVRTQSEPYASVKDPSTYRQWCIDNGFAQQMSLPWQTTNKIVKDMLLDAKEPPPGVEAYFRTSVVFTPDKEEEK